MSESADAPGGASGAQPKQGNADRDLSFLWPVIDRIRAVEIKFNPEEGVGASAGVKQPDAGLEARIKFLEDEVASLKNTLQGTLGALTAGVVEAAGAVEAAIIELPAQQWWRTAVAAVAGVSLLLLAHWLIVFVYDRPTIMLRLVSIAIPLPLAIWLTLRCRITPWVEILFGFLLGAIAVFGMAYVTSLHEKTSFMPENMREWQETLEYTASIMFAHLTGVLISSAIQARSGAQNRAGAATLRLAQVIAFVTGRAVAGGPQLKKHVETVQGLVNNLMPVASAIMAIVTGIKGILG
jgi:hypothetical protein